MREQIEVVYENGVFRPLEALAYVLLPVWRNDQRHRPD